MGYMTMMLVDTIMVGKLGAPALAGVGVGSNVFFAINAVFMGTLLSIDSFAPKAFGKAGLVGVMADAATIPEQNRIDRADRTR